MVVCKFFQQGYCRFGQSCRNEHIYGSKYSYHASSAPAQQQVQQAPSGAVTDEQLVNQVQTDLKAVVNGRQWLFSCYAPFKERQRNFPGIHDLCPEEARLLFYEARANNKLKDAEAYMNNLALETRQKFEQLVNPNPSIVRVLRSLYNGENPPSPFASNTSAGAATSIFRNAAQSASIFHQNPVQSVFTQQENTAAKSIFAQASQNAFTNQAVNKSSNNIFAPSQPQSPFAPANSQNVFAPIAAKSIFAQANQNITYINPSQPNSSSPQNVFATASRQTFGPSDPFSKPNATDIFKQTGSSDPFNQQNSPFSQSTNVFQTAQAGSNIFGGNVQQNETNSDDILYSKEEELTAEQIEAFKSDSFKLGFVPEIAPPHSLCAR